MSMSKNMELLAPAGDMNCALAAFDAGADAIYAGLKKFNARERSGNFTFEEYGSLIRYAHEKGKKVYTTFNTVLRESEIEEASEFLAELQYLHPDAVIVQDFGVLRMIREYFPTLTIHASTQMALHNSDDIAVASALGIKRVILERQTTLDELKIIASKSPLELEVFVHGALCCCLSGSCLLSSWFGGASGNRGKCKQPCRRLFRNDKNKEGFYLSTGDLAAFSLIPEFRKMGIASLKIEGRLRKPDYVTKVTEAYRYLLDTAEKDFPEALKEAEKLFARTASRHSSLGFYKKETAQKVIRAGEVGGIGQYCGKVTKVLPNALETTLAGRVHIGDYLRVQGNSGDTGEVFCVLSLKVNNKECLKALPGMKCVIGTKEKNIPVDGVIYRIGEAGSNMEKRIRKLPPFKPEISMNLSLNHEELSISFPLFPEKKWSEKLFLAEAQKHFFSSEELAAAFSSMGQLPFVPVVKKAEVAGKFFFPASLLKEIRRKFGIWCNEDHLEALWQIHCRKNKEKLLSDYALLTGSPAETAEKERIVTEKDQERFYPFFVPQYAVEEVEKKFRSLAEEKNIREFYIASPGGFLLKKKCPEKELKLILAPPVPLANSFAAAEFQAMGASEGIIHTELGKEDMELLARKSPLKLLLYGEGRPVLFATRASVEKTNFLQTEDKERFLVRKENILTVLYPEKPLLFPEENPIAHTVFFRDRRLLDERKKENKESSPFNFFRGLS